MKDLFIEEIKGIGKASLTLTAIVTVIYLMF